MIVERIELENFMCYAGKKHSNSVKELMLLLVIMAMGNLSYTMHSIG